MNKHDEIKKLLRSSRELLISKNTILEFENIKKQYGILNEQYDLTRSNPTKKIDVGKSIETDMDDNIGQRNNTEDEPIKSKRDLKSAWRISGGVLVLHGKEQTEIKLTSDEKIAFQETMEEFVNEVSDLVEYKQLNVYENSVQWAGKLLEFNVDFMYVVGEENGVYMKGDMITMTDNFMDVVEKLKNYYDKFKSKWSKIIASRKKTKVDDETNDFE